MDKPPDRQAINERHRAIEREKAKQAEKEKMYDTLLKYFTLLDKYKMKYAPADPKISADERYVYAVKNIEYAAYLLETFDRTGRQGFEEIKLEVDRIGQEYERICEQWGE